MLGKLTLWVVWLWGWAMIFPWLLSLAATDLKPIQGFNRFVEWVKERGLKCAAVTEASHENATNILKILGVDDLFDILVIGNECENSDPYLIAFNKLGIQPNEAFVLQVKKFLITKSTQLHMASERVKY